MPEWMLKKTKRMSRGFAPMVTLTSESCKATLTEHKNENMQMDVTRTGPV